MLALRRSACHGIHEFHTHLARAAPFDSTVMGRSVLEAQADLRLADRRLDQLLDPLARSQWRLDALVRAGDR